MFSYVFSHCLTIIEVYVFKTKHYRYRRDIPNFQQLHTIFYKIYLEHLDINIFITNYDLFQNDYSQYNCMRNRIINLCYGQDNLTIYAV